MDTVIIHPVPATELKNLAKELLALADNPRDVEYVMWPEPGFRVPEDLATKFVAGRGTAVEQTEQATEVEEVPVRRKPGRPKKEAQ